MPSEIRELLEEARAGAPPMRYDVDFVWLAGRRRRRKRAAGWTIAAVVAVAAAIGVPQIVARRADQPQPLKLPAPVVITTPKSGEVLPFVLRFHGYDAGGYRVAEPNGVGVDGVSTRVYKIGGSQDSLDNAQLWLYEPGVDHLAGHPTGVRAEDAPIKGRRAFWFTADPGRSSVAEDWLCWEYADDALAILKPDPIATMSRATMRQVAEGLTPSAERTVTVPFKVGYVPTGWKVNYASGTPGGAPGKAGGFLTFEPGTFAAAEMKEPDRHVPVKLLEPHGALNLGVSLVPADQHMPLLPSPEVGGSDPTKVDCDVEGCYHPVDNGRYRVRAGGSIDDAEIRKMLASVVEADPDDPATWFPVHQAVPDAALIRMP